MTRSLRTLLLAGIGTAALLGALAIAGPLPAQETPPGPTAADAPGWRMHRWMDREHRRGWMERGERSPRDMCNRVVDMRAAFLAGAESRLRLSAEQQPAWDAFEAAATANRDEVIAFCATLPDEAGRGTAPERLDQMTGGARLMLAMLEGVNAPFKALYVVLTEDQRKIVDEFPMHGRRHGWRH